MSAKKKQQVGPAAPAVNSTAALVELVPASQFRRYPTNRVVDELSVANMAASIRDHGVIQPILARPVENAETGAKDLEIVFGETRWRGCCEIDENYLVPCVIREMTDKEAAKVHAVENFQRKDLNELEEAREIEHMLSQGWVMAEIAIHVGRTVQYLYGRVALLKLPESGKDALLAGNMTIHTANKIVSLPEDKREAAVDAVVDPSHSARALPEREALRVINDQFVVPMQEEGEWNEKRKLLESENPDAVWLDFAKAQQCGNYTSNFEKADERPSYSLLSDSARNSEMAIPTWGELATKHGGQFYIGIDEGTSHALYVVGEALIEAEKLACEDHPEDCVFTHEKAIQRMRMESERRKMEREAQVKAFEEEQVKFAQAMLAGPSTKTATKKFVLEVAKAFFDSVDEMANLFGLRESDYGDEYAMYEEAVDNKIHNFLTLKTSTPFEQFGRLVAASEMHKSWNDELLASMALDTGAVKAKDFPEFARVLGAVVNDNGEEVDA